MQQISVRINSLSTLASRLSAGACIALSCGAVAAIFLCDVLSPINVVFSMLYVAPIVLTLLYGSPRATYFVFVGSSVATVAAAAFASMPADATAAITNRALALVAQTLAAAIVMQKLEQRDRGMVLATASSMHAPASVAISSSAKLLALAHAVRPLPDAVFVVGAEGIIVDANDRASQLLEIPLQALLGSPWQLASRRFVASVSDGQAIQSELALAGWPASGPDVVTGEHMLRRDAGPGAHCLVSASVIREADVVLGAIVVAHDISALRQNEREKDDFVSMATHELRSPITTLRGYAQLTEAAATRAGSPDVAATAAKVVRQADRVSRLVSDLLDVSRVQSGRLELCVSEISVTTLVRDAIEQQRAIHPGREFALAEAPGIPVVRADAHRLEQVLANLLDNAVKYSPDGGNVTVTLSCRDGHAQIQVADNGIGIPTEEQGHLFERFYRARSGARRFTGLGVGLYISYRIVRAHGGRMWVESDTSGSAFIFTLPPAGPKSGRLNFMPGADSNRD